MSYMCLSDKKSREDYDQNGSQAKSNRRYQKNFEQKSYEEEFDFFDLFAGNAYGHRDQYKNKNQANRKEKSQDQDTKKDKKFQMFPIILLLVGIVLLSIGFRTSSNPAYSFSKTDRYKFELETSNHNVKYYVDQHTFDLIRASQTMTVKIENTVDNDFYQRMTRI